MTRYNTVRNKVLLWVTRDLALNYFILLFYDFQFFHPLSHYFDSSELSSFLRAPTTSRFSSPPLSSLSSPLSMLHTATHAVSFHRIVGSGGLLDSPSSAQKRRVDVILEFVQIWLSNCKRPRRSDHSFYSEGRRKKLAESKRSLFAETRDTYIYSLYIKESAARENV